MVRLQIGYILHKKILVLEQMLFGADNTVGFIDSCFKTMDLQDYCIIIKKASDRFKAAIENILTCNTAERLIKSFL